ncbi:MAG TPA: HAMP domain-containing sensor histidine kinase [Gaiellaceae bacterium]|nr:HAMP domain-containing sensor histidine kinase [Gaiellaceae bacterium]
MIWNAIVVAAATLGVGLLLAVALRGLPTVRLQIAGLAALAVCLPLAAVLLSGWVMFHMGDDKKILAVSAASAAVAVVAGLWLGRSIANAVDAVRDASGRLARGDLTVRAPEAGPTEIAELAASFNEMAANLERLFDARRELVAWASHDLRTPLANIQAMLEALHDGVMQPAEALPPLEEQARALSTLVDDLFELAQIDAGALSLELEEAPLAGPVRTSLRGVEAEARLRGIRLDADLDGDVRARFAPSELQRVLQNLLTNALRHTPSDGSVAIRVSRGPDEVRVTVEDSGEGLGEEARDRMFERFWRGDRARSARGGGLGLAIAKALVEAQGGRIWAEDRPGGGARVSFTLPAA